MAEGVVVGYTVSALLALLGLVVVASPNVLVGMEMWRAQSMFGGKFTPGSKTRERAKLFGGVLVIIAVLLALLITALGR